MIEIVIGTIIGVIIGFLVAILFDYILFRIWHNRAHLKIQPGRYDKHIKTTRWDRKPKKKITNDDFYNK